MTIYHLEERGVISITGEEAIPFLQSLLSNDIRKAGPDNFLYALLLTPQGKILYDFFIITQPDGYWLDVQKSLIAEIIKKLTLYKLRAKVEIKEQPSLSVYAIPDKSKGFIDPRHPELGNRLIGNLDHADENVIDYHRLLMNHLVPNFATDILPDVFLPLDLNLDQYDAIDYKKGCYVGQEVTARMHYRGVKRKQLMIVDIDTSLSNIYQTCSVEQNDKKIGKMLGICDLQGLALIKEELCDVNAVCTIVDAEEKIVAEMRLRSVTEKI